MIKWLLRIFFLILFVGVAGLGYLCFAAIEDQPLVSGRAAVASSEHAGRVKSLIQRYQDGARQNLPTAKLSVTEQDLESLLVFAARGVPSALADAQISTQGMNARLTIDLPANPIGRYFNFSFGLLPSTRGLALSHVQFGGISVPPALFQSAMMWGLDRLLGDGAADGLTGTINAVHFTASEMTLRYTPDQRGSEELISRISGNPQLRIADPERVQIYFTRLQQIATELRGGYVSLTRYIKPLFELATARSQPDGGDAISENKAAILALAIYFGDARMAALAGGEEEKYFSGSRYGSHNVTIKGRHDLVQHFLTAAGLQLAAGVDIANAIGEFKEIADTLRGGSGFSVSDIAGDRAGVVLAERAISSNRAKSIQAALARVTSEEDFFPDISGLPDNMTQAEFERRYGNVESPLYIELLADIERRITDVAIYGAQ